MNGSGTAEQQSDAKRARRSSVAMKNAPGVKEVRKEMNEGRDIG